MSMVHILAKTVWKSRPSKMKAGYKQWKNMQINTIILFVRLYFQK